MKIFPFLVLSLSFFLGGCGKIIRSPWPKSPPETEEKRETDKKKEEAKDIKKNIEKITEYELQAERLKQQLLNKRGQGYDTAEAETALQTVQDIVRSLKDLNFWAESQEQFEEIRKKFKALDEELKKTRDLIKRAPPFAGQEIKKEKKIRKYGDDRDFVAELAGEPDLQQIHERGLFSLDLFIFNPSPILRQSVCWNPARGTFHLENTPRVITWFYPQTMKMYVFMETGPALEQFMLRNDLNEGQRDNLLVRLCAEQTFVSALRLIYVGAPITDTEQIFQQLLTGVGRTADMFGIGALERLAKAQAVLPDLNIAALAFSINFHSLNLQQGEQAEQFVSLMKRVRLAVTVLPEKDKKALKKRQKREKEIDQAVVKILQWSITLNPRRKHIDELVKLFLDPDAKREIRETGKRFGETIQQLEKERQRIKDDLFKFRVDFGEGLVFLDNQFIAFFLLAQGVRFEEKINPDGSRIEEPDLSVKITIKMRRGKYEEPVAFTEKNIKITNANKIFNEMREYERLTSFGLVFSERLPAGSYEVVLQLTDNLRAQTTEKIINWLIFVSPVKSEN